MKERKYLKNTCIVCGKEQIGVHYHEAKPVSEEKRVREFARHYHQPVSDIVGFNRLLIKEGIKPVKREKLKKILNY